MAKNKNEPDYNENLIISIISECLKSMPGVSRHVGGGLTESITHNVLGREIQSQGIKINVEDDNLIINISIIVYYGVNIPQLCYDIQSKIKHLLEYETKINVKSINIRVDGVDTTTED